MLVNKALTILCWAIGAFCTGVPAMPYESQNDFDSYDDIQHLIAEGILKPDTLAYVVTRQAIALGIASLSSWGAQ
jgi:hypothetical protein